MAARRRRAPIDRALQLVALEGAAAGVEYQLGSRPLTIGRSPRCNIRIDDGFISWEHCRVEPNASGFLIVDLDSRNGTLLNGQPLQTPTALRAGDLVVVGKALFEVRSAPSTQPGRAAPGSATRSGRKADPAPPPAEQTLQPAAVAAAHEAARSGRLMEARLQGLLDDLASLEQGDRRAEALRVLATCRQADLIRDPNQRAALVGVALPEIRRTVAASLALLSALLDVRFAHGPRTMDDGS